MNTTLKILFSVLLLGFFSSCEKVIEVDLKNVEKKYVIEAMISDREGDAKVMISRTTDFNEPNFFDGISGATVTIQEENATPWLLTETDPGIYQSQQAIGTSGKKYTLLVTIDGNNFNAISTMPVKVMIDSVYVTDEFLFTDTRKIVNVDYQDPVGKGNNFRHIQYINNVRMEELFLSTDDYTDGRLNTNKLFYYDDKDDEKGIQPGDTIRIDMQCIEPAIFTYWFSVLRGATGSTDQASPANPVTNIKGGALGYFNAHTIESKELIVP